jgi:hypothetical protein
VICAAAGRKIDEQSYLAALSAVDSRAARRTDGDELEKHLAGAAAIADLATANLRAQGHYAGASGFEDLYVREVERIHRKHGIAYTYGGRHTSA